MEDHLVRSMGNLLKCLRMETTYQERSLDFDLEDSIRKFLRVLIDTLEKEQIPSYSDPLPCSTSNMMVGKLENHKNRSMFYFE